MEYNRLNFLNRLVKEKKFRSYLEIGVFLGKIFFHISAKKKIAVDPYFRFGLYRKFKRIFRNITNLRAKFYEKTSDAFFAEDAPGLYRDSKLDICLVDGMHEYQFALRDVDNTLRYLQEQGVIIMHDCNPLTAKAAISFEGWKANNFQGVWNGDVWKAVVHLRSTRDDINVFVLDCDEGLGIVTFGKPENKLNFTPQQIDSFTYEQFSQNRKEWLNLKPASYFFEFFGVSNEE